MLSSCPTKKETHWGTAVGPAQCKPWLAGFSFFPPSP